MQNILEKLVTIREGEPCLHPGCLQHITHPCEVCHRIGGKGVAVYDIALERRKWKHKFQRFIDEQVSLPSSFADAVNEHFTSDFDRTNQMWNNRK